MNLVSRKDIRDLLSKRRGNYKLRVCVRPNKLIILKTSKIFYNHKRISKSCKGVHITISRDTIKDDLRLLKKCARTTNGNFILRKLRSDTNTKHRYPRKTKVQSGKTSTNKDADGKQCINIVEEYPSYFLRSIGDYNSDELVL